jgi:hypothetical protein
MILLRVPPLPGRQDLCDNASLPPLLVDLLRDLSRLLLLLGVVIENCATVLAACIRTLSVRGRRVVHLVEEFEKRGVRYLLRVVDDLEGFGVCSGC